MGKNGQEKLTAILGLIKFYLFWSVCLMFSYFSQWIKKIMESATFCPGISQTTTARNKKEIKTFPTTRQNSSCEFWKDHILLLVIILWNHVWLYMLQIIIDQWDFCDDGSILYLCIPIPIWLLNTWNEATATEQLNFTFNLIQFTCGF